MSVVTLAYHASAAEEVDALASHLADHGYTTARLVCEAGAEPLATRLLDTEGPLLLFVNDDFLHALPCQVGLLDAYAQLEARSRFHPVMASTIRRGPGEVTARVMTSLARVSDVIRYMNFWQSAYLTRRRDLGSAASSTGAEELAVLRRVSQEIGQVLRRIRATSPEDVRTLSTSDAGALERLLGPPASGPKLSAAPEAPGELAATSPTVSAPVLAPVVGASAKTDGKDAGPSAAENTAPKALAPVSADPALMTSDAHERDAAIAPPGDAIVRGRGTGSANAHADASPDERAEAEDRGATVAETEADVEAEAETEVETDVETVADASPEAGLAHDVGAEVEGGLGASPPAHSESEAADQAAPTAPNDDQAPFRETRIQDDLLLQQDNDPKSEVRDRGPQPDETPNQNREPNPGVRPVQTLGGDPERRPVDALGVEQKGVERQDNDGEPGSPSIDAGDQSAVAAAGISAPVPATPPAPPEASDGRSVASASTTEEVASPPASADELDEAALRKLRRKAKRLTRAANLKTFLAHRDREGFDAAADFARAALAQDPGDHKLRYAFSVTLIEHAETTDESVEELRTVIAPLLDSPLAAQAHLCLGQLALRRKDYGSGRLHLTKAYKLNREVDRELPYRLGALLQDEFEDQRPRAMKYLRRAAKRSRVHRADANYRLGLLEWAAGRRRRAIRHLKLALRLEPGHPFAAYDLAVVYRERGRGLRARTFFKRAVRVNPELDTPANREAFLRVDADGISTRLPETQADKFFDFVRDRSASEAEAASSESSKPSAAPSPGGGTAKTDPPEGMSPLSLSVIAEDDPSRGVSDRAEEGERGGGDRNRLDANADLDHDPDHDAGSGHDPDADGGAPSGSADDGGRGDRRTEDDHSATETNEGAPAAEAAGRAEAGASEHEVPRDADSGGATGTDHDDRRRAKQSSAVGGAGPASALRAAAASIQAALDAVRGEAVALTDLTRKSADGSGARTVLITGASSGIGAATARGFAKAGHKLILTGRRVDRLLALSNELKREYDAAVRLLSFDVSDFEAAEQMVDSLEGEWAAVDVLVNNAGKARGLKPVHEMDAGEIDDMVDTNVKGVLYMTRLVAAGMVARGRGHVINVCSTAGHEVYAGGTVYCATKHAVDAITRGTRLDVFRHGVRVSQVSPAAVEETEFSEVRFAGDRERAAGVYEGWQPLRAGDVAAQILAIATAPAHVNVQDVVILGTQQGNSTSIERSGRG